MPSLHFEQVSKRFGDVVVVEEFSLHVEDGELLVLVGGSGSGKSTILRMAAGLESVSSGSIRIDERDITHLPPRERDVAMVFQDYALYPHMTVRENLSLGLRLRKFARAEIDRRVQWAAEMLGIDALLDRKPKQLSGGQRQRVAMGRAMVREPMVFLFDEPLSNLDAGLRARMRIEIGALQRRLKTTTVFVTHDQVEAMTLGDRIVVLADGRIQQVGRPIELYRSPVNRFVAGFIGTPPMNFIDGVVQVENGRAQFVSDGVRVELAPERMRDAPSAKALTLGVLPGGPVTLGVRPEDLELVMRSGLSDGMASERSGETAGGRIDVAASGRIGYPAGTRFGDTADA
ncbi:MAG: ATP-binding cassette domain-containing protein, partial [Gemmatimonadetes bacterium]|nr:ATP-binding cassette domain-containing protein [Gemmatimonadota bacterium]